MSRELRFDGRVALVTGAGNGLGRAYARLLASRGARVVVNDLGGAMTGGGASASAADAVVDEIRAAGGEAVASYASVEEGESAVQVALDTWGRLDIVINNAGILRDKTFIKMTEEDWERVYRVHVYGAYKVTAAAWPVMRDQQGYGRIVMTSSAAGLYGNFGQANYSMAKLGLAGFANTLALEGRRYNIRVNTVAPLAGSRLTETVLPPELVAALRPEVVAPVVAWLCHERCEESGGIFEVGGGFMAKLRWERSAGRTFRLGREITPEQVEAGWGEVVDFSRSTHPTQIAEAMAPVMQNVEAGPSKGGNAFIDVDAALGYVFPEMTSSWDERDLALYALGVGAASDPLDRSELAYVYELNGAGFRPLPTYGVVPAINCVLALAQEGHQAPGIHYGIDRILHGEQYTEVMRPLPPKATLTHRSKIADIFDKGKNALVITETESFDAQGELLIRNRTTILVRGVGGWGGDRGPAESGNTPPERAPDAVVEQVIEPNQALLYRLSGDWNPLHADPDMAQAVGFPRPILHGLCTFGYVGRHAIKALCGGDPRRFKSINVRFAASVFPGETLVTELWQESPTRIIVQARVKERDVIVVNHGAVELYETIPEPKRKAAPAAAAAPTPAAPEAPAQPASWEVFIAMGAYVSAHPELVGQVGKVYRFKLSGPEATWTLNLKDGAGSVEEGEVGSAECTLELSEADFMALVRGEVKPEKLYFGGQLKISGDIMASQKLTFLSKINPKEARAAVEAAKAAKAAKPADAAPKAAARSAAAPGIFGALPERLAGRAGGGPVLQFKVSEPDGMWIVDLSVEGGRIDEGVSSAPDATVSLKDEALAALAAGEQTAQALYQRGALRLDGDARAAGAVAGLWGQG